MNAPVAKLAIVLKISIAISTIAQLFLIAHCVNHTQKACNASNANMDMLLSISNVKKSHALTAALSVETQLHARFANHNTTLSTRYASQKLDLQTIFFKICFLN
jgi:hypothetical protein